MSMTTRLVRPAASALARRSLASSQATTTTARMTGAIAHRSLGASRGGRAGLTTSAALRFATPTSPEVDAAAAAAASSSSESKRGPSSPPPPPPDMAASLDRILPPAVFASAQQGGGGGDGGETMLAQGLAGEFPPEPLARQVVETVLSQLRASVDARTEAETLALQTAANDEVRSQLLGAAGGNDAAATTAAAATLHGLATRILRLSKDPRRFPIAFRLFAIAFGVEPASLPDPTQTPPAPTATATATAANGSSSGSAGEPLAGAGSFGIDAAGYSWASMVLGGQSPPPPGIHLLKPGSREYVAAVARQQASAVRIYATLAMRGDAQGMLGMGRVLVAGTRRADPVPGKSGAEAQKEVELMLQRATALWTRAGSLGVGEAYFELGLLALNDGGGSGSEGKSSSEGNGEGEQRAREYFALGASKGDARSDHALGIMYTQAAMAINDAAQQAKRDELLALSMDHFVKAADKGGDAQSAHNVGLRYLLRDELVAEIRQGQVGADGTRESGDGRSDDEVLRQARARHQALWGVAPDDAEAKRWFQKAAELGSAPGMMNYAGMLVEGRGSDMGALSAAAAAASAADAPQSKEEALATILDARIMELKAAESLYAKVAAHSSVLEQQQQQASSSDEGGLDAAGREMGNFAKEAMSTVQQLIQKLLDEKEAMAQQKQA
ncbi:hypothetical protein FA10DRAFT_280555 [Acaromyces ingoldii]|uniref:HCP-like protein n=1 Tax=Acaromyces ingoldii TaxID=215250 RepID=A0A316YPA7_9BASI|nr:hypothetical protein FA10DRAFT_280555 [Acaromyces ingoldii]PWN89575.1 hypothetical protein FA10DRAFT_280555 [Acaromyces ingoldii]